MFKFFRKKKSEPIVEQNSTDCICHPNIQAYCCPAGEKCIWHPSNDPYGLKHRKWVYGKFVDTRKSNKDEDSLL